MSVAQRELTIDELAARTGMTVRNIRAHQARGLLPPPAVRGRTGYYGDEHVARIDLIQDLQRDGFNLEAIRRLLEHAEGSTEDVLRFTRSVRAPVVEEPRVVDLAELARRWPEVTDPAPLRRAVELGLLRDLGGGRFEERSPRLARAGRALADRGIPPETALDVLALARDHARAVAEAYVQLFVDQVWRPFDEAGRPASRWPEVLRALEDLRPLAGESLLAIFGLELEDATERAFGRELERAAP